MSRTGPDHCSHRSLRRSNGDIELAQHRQQPQGGLLGRIRLRSPVRVLLAVAVVSVIVGTHGQFLDPVCRAISLSCQLLHLRIQHQRLAESNEQLADVVAYLKTEDGQELAARSELGALKKGERLIICQPSQLTASRDLSISQWVYRGLRRGHKLWRNTVTYLADLAVCLFYTSETSFPEAVEDPPGNPES